MSIEEILNELRSKLLEFDKEATQKIAVKALDSGIDPLQIINTLTKTMEGIGERFGKGEIFLAELMMSGDAMKSAMDIVLKKIPKDTIHSTGTVLVGTVKGDVHDIGKNILISMLTAAGFEVYDLGTDVQASKFAEEAMRISPDIVAASALMTTTMPMLKELIQYFRELGIRDKFRIMVGGGAVIKEYAEEIGADGYGADAVEGTKVAKKLLSQ